MDNFSILYGTADHVIKVLWNKMAVHTSSVLRHAETVHNRNLAMASLINQVLFFMLCDRWFCPEDRLTGLYSLLFYNVFGYLFVYAGRLLSLHNYSPIVRVSEHTNIRHLAMTATKVVLDLAKVVTFAITCVFMLLVFGLEQGLEHFSPTWSYIILTAFYFVLTEPKCKSGMTSSLVWLHIDALESMEALWIPIVRPFLSSFISVIMITIVWFFTDGGWMLVFSASYINVYLGLRVMGDHWQELLREKASIDKYRFATPEELSEKDDVCAVCLQGMRCARVTPCKHIFHGECLRRCLKQENICPMCKQAL